MLLVTIGVLVGSMCGLAFRAWALVPVTAVGAIAATVTELAQGSGWGPAAAFCCVVSLALQFGYGLGLVLRKIDRLAPVAAEATTGTQGVNRV